MFPHVGFSIFCSSLVPLLKVQETFCMIMLLSQAFLGLEYDNFMAAAIGTRAVGWPDWNACQRSSNHPSRELESFSNHRV